MEKTKIPNKLLNESSPYLQQHAHNPVDWYPWGEEAFAKAETEDKPVFLSIGYSTCHWCHVMAHESFENQQIAELLNQDFVSIKVDREERPDIDEVYMNVCQAMTGSGGWPLTVIMTPERKPFFAGTYFPPESAYGRMGLGELLLKVADLWRTERKALIEHGETVSRMIRENRTAKGVTQDEAAIIEGGFEAISGAYESAYGGFSHAPKFPTPHYILFLLRYWKAHGNESALSMAESTLTHMYRGGIFDHIGYGFSRYSTDQKWLVPHFEKMLYDNALLLRAYTECFAATGKEIYRDVVQKICVYLFRDMLSPEGGFFSAQDADSEGVEGKYYVWDYAELEKALDSDELSALEACYGISQKGNFEGKNILNMIHAHNEPTDTALHAIEKLFALRQKRVPPFKDTKISASWNGLVIGALAYAGATLNMPEYVEAAEKAAEFVLRHMTDENGSLSGTWKDGRSSEKGFLSDYANMAAALTELYVTTRKLCYIHDAETLADAMIRRFYDVSDNRFYMTETGNAELFIRPRDEYDGAMPSGASSAIMALLRLYRLTGDPKWKPILDRSLETFMSTASVSPSSHIHFLSMLLERNGRQIIIAADADSEDARKVYHTLTGRFDPFTTVIFYDKSDEMGELFPELVQYKTDQPFAGYVCENFTCRKPVYRADELMQLADQKQ